MAEKLTIEELRGRIGQEVGVSKWIDILQSAIDAFGRHEERLQRLSLRPSAKSAVARSVGTTLPAGALTSTFTSVGLFSTRWKKGQCVSIRWVCANQTRWIKA